MLCLHAPVVAVLWQAALALAHVIRLTPMLSAGLALACWVVCLLDRLLDPAAVKGCDGPDVLQAFSQRYRRVILLGVVPPALLLLAWMALFVVPEGVLWQALSLALLVALYLASWSAQGSRLSRDVFVSCAGLGGIMLLSHTPVSGGMKLTLSLLVLSVMVLSFLRQMDLRMGNVLPRELTAAVLFAMGCTTSTRFLGMPETVAEPVLECVLLTLLFACHLQLVSRDRAGLKNDRKNPPLMLGTLVFIIAVLELARAGVLEHSVFFPARAALGGLLLLGLVHAARRRLPAEAFRVLADLALVLPPVLGWLLESLLKLHVA